MLITRTSQISGVTRQMDLPITEEQVSLYESGVYVQDAFPQLSSDEREFIKTGITAEEWDSIFGGCEE